VININDFPEQHRSLVFELLCHRYRYYVLHNPTISDYQYDMLERPIVRDEVMGDLFGVGSENPESYPLEVRELFINEKPLVFE
jgi:hypothetical protein